MLNEEKAENYDSDFDCFTAPSKKILDEFDGYLDFADARCLKNGQGPGISHGYGTVYWNTAYQG